MVKGVSRQVIVVRQPDTKLFEQAIFMLREEALGRSGVTDRQVLQEACRVADQYVQTHAGTARRHRRFAPGRWVYMALGAALTAAAWLLWALL